MNITREEVRKLALISRITIEEAEIEPILKQLGDVLSYAQCVTQLGAITQEYIISKNKNYYREDKLELCNARELLMCSTEHDEHFFIVPKIIEK